MIFTALGIISGCRFDYAMNYKEFLKFDIDLSSVGFAPSYDNQPYFCTPEGAQIIGCAGVDGIHYCTIPELGETVFAVSPMECAPDYVHPIARTFGELLGLLLACGDMAAIEQAWMWDKAQFWAFVKDNPPTSEQEQCLDKLRALGIAPADQPWEYMFTLRSEFDYSGIRYTDEYYDLTGEPRP